MKLRIDTFNTGDLFERAIALILEDEVDARPREDRKGFGRLGDHD